MLAFTSFTQIPSSSQPPGGSAQALERQKEYTDAIRIERDELREEVVKLQDILKVLRQCGNCELRIPKFPKILKSCEVVYKLINLFTIKHRK